MLPLALLAALVPSVVGVTGCISCATPGLRNNWLMTGIEKPPGGLQFLDGCGSLVEGDGFTIASVTKTCEQDYCMEMAIPTGDGDHWEFLRGCYSNLVKAETNTAGLTPVDLAGKNGLCQKYTFDNQKENIVHYCKGEAVDPATPEAVPTGCNFRVKFNGKAPTRNIPAERGYECAEIAQKIDCVTCTRTDTMGTCDSSTKASAKGPLCVKIRGMVNGREFEERGPSFIPPFAETSWDKCGIPLTLNSTTYLGPAFGTSAGQSASARRKRSLKQLFGGTKCYCKTGMCNGSPIMGGLPATIVLVLSAVPFFL